MNNTDTVSKEDYDKLLKDFKLLASMYKDTKLNLNNKIVECDKLTKLCIHKEKQINSLIDRICQIQQTTKTIIVNTTKKIQSNNIANKICQLWA